jgi:hypothetical protein
LEIVLIIISVLLLAPTGVSRLFERSSGGSREVEEVEE